MTNGISFRASVPLRFVSYIPSFHFTPLSFHLPFSFNKLSSLPLPLTLFFNLVDMPPYKSSRIKGRGVFLSLIPIDSENSSTHLSTPSSISPPSSTTKRSTPPPQSGKSNKKYHLDFEKSIDIKTDFWYSSKETLF